MIKYYGTPLSPIKIFNEAMEGRNCLIPFPNPQDFKRAVKLCDKVILDNGAFTTWGRVKKGKIENINWDEHWGKYYLWVEENISFIEFFFIPDVIDGTEEENDDLLQEFIDKYKYEKDGMKIINKGVPIWHINESLERLDRLVKGYEYIAIGSAGEYATLGTFRWHRRMNEAMGVICSKDGTPKVKVHMLRCLNPKIFMMYPFYSGDSTGLAQNHSRDGWENVVNRIEPFNSPKKYGELGGLFA